MRAKVRSGSHLGWTEKNTIVADNSKIPKETASMKEELIKLGGKKKNSTFMDKVKDILPEGGNLNLCLTCGACSSGCPATGLVGMDPRKFLRMAALGLDQEIAKSDWPWRLSFASCCCS